MNIRPPVLAIGLGLLACLLGARPADAVTLRIVSYDIEADIDGQTSANSGLDVVLEAIGQEDFNGVLRPIDVLALQETASNASTVAPIVDDLNAYYGAGTYAMSSYQATATADDPDDGTGPNALIYNTTTLTLVESVGIGTPEGPTNGEYRQVVRYELEPVGGTLANAFYVYVSHMKSSDDGDTAADEVLRNEEAQIIRADSATLPSLASVLYVGDFNLAGSFEPAYQTLTATGAAQGIDPLNTDPQDNSEYWDSAEFEGILTEAVTDLTCRDDIQFVSANAFTGSVAGGLQLLAGSYHAFGNNGTTAYGDSIDSFMNTAPDDLTGPITVKKALNALTTASDHLPVVADYTIDLSVNAPTLAPVITSAADTAARVGTPFKYVIAAANLPAAFSATGLPNGLAVLNSSTGLIGGTPNVAGTFHVTLTATNVIGTGKAALTLTIAPVVLPSVSVAATVPVAYADGSVPGRFTITRKGTLTKQLAVKYTLTGSGKNGIDYAQIPATAKIKPGQASVSIAVKPVDARSIGDGTRTVRITLSPEETYTVAAKHSAVVTIRDDR
jgi:endonuclease/exonuclease/phosphatase family metal-dependent hydrolase